MSLLQTFFSRIFLLSFLSTLNSSTLIFEELLSAAEEEASREVIIILPPIELLQRRTIQCFRIVKPLSSFCLLFFFLSPQGGHSEERHFSFLLMSGSVQSYYYSSWWHSFLSVSLLLFSYLFSGSPEKGTVNADLITILDNIPCTPFLFYMSKISL